MSFAWISCIVSPDASGLHCGVYRNICACCDSSWCAVECWRLITHEERWPAQLICHLLHGLRLSPAPADIIAFKSLRDKRLDRERLDRLTLNIRAVDIALDFPYVKWPVDGVSTPGLFISPNVRERLACVSKRVEQHCYLWRDRGRRKSALLCSGIIESLYYRIFIHFLFQWKKEDENKHMYTCDRKFDKCSLKQNVCLMQKKWVGGE